jgi:hypothetical protein
MLLEALSGAMEVSSKVFPELAEGEIKSVTPFALKTHRPNDL